MHACCPGQPDRGQGMLFSPTPMFILTAGSSHTCAVAALIDRYLYHYNYGAVRLTTSLTIILWVGMFSISYG